MINRRELFKRLGLAAGAVGLAPLVEKLSSGMTITLADLHRDTNPLGSRVKIGPNAPMFTAAWKKKLYAEYKRDFEFKAGDQWPEQVKEGRTALKINRIPNA